MRILLPIDGSAGSVAAVREVADCPMAQGSMIELLYIIHSRVPVIPDFPPWAFTVASAHGEIVRKQIRHAPELPEAAATYLRVHQPQAIVVTKIVEGVPKKEILGEAVASGQIESSSAHTGAAGAIGRFLGRRRRPSPPRRRVPSSTTLMLRLPLAVKSSIIAARLRCY